MNEQISRQNLDTLCAALCQVMGVEAPAQAAEANQFLCDYVAKALEGRKVDRVFMYNPDAIAQWVMEKHPELVPEIPAWTELALPLSSVMPTVTPVNFGTMYTGAQPQVHGITAYRKPVITIDSLFDALIRAGRKPAVVADKGSSLSRIFLEREMDYFICDTLEEVNAKAAELILRDEYDFIVVYNHNYDSVMHKVGPEGAKALGELRANAETFAMFSAMIREHWQQHDSLVGFAMDHGCHEIDGDCGSHGLDMPEDVEIQHHYRVWPRQEKSC